MKLLTSSLALCVLIPLLGGCASRPTPRAARHQDEPIVAQIAPAGFNQALPPQIVPAPQSSTPDPSPVYKQSVVKKVYLDAYVDGGVAYEPAVKWVVAEQGGWDLDAIRNPNRAYVPPSMSGNQPISQNGHLAPGEVPVAQKTATIRDLYEVENVTVTGFVERGQEPLAREVATKMGSDFIAVFDPDLGWLVIPKPVLQPTRG